MYQYILFDLDGTLTDSGEGITRCVQYALESFGIHETDEEKLLRFIGPPLLESFMEFYGFDREQAFTAVKKYRERFAPIGIFENRLYPGIDRMLNRLKAQGRTLAVATSKPQMYVGTILEQFGILPCFSSIQGSKADGLGSQKIRSIQEVLEELNISPNMYSQVVMVGDRHYDVNGAAAFGMDSIGVLYGYGSREELEQAGAAYLAEDVDVLERLLV